MHNSLVISTENKRNRILNELHSHTIIHARCFKKLDDATTAAFASVSFTELLVRVSDTLVPVYIVPVQIRAIMSPLGEVYCIRPEHRLQPIYLAMSLAQPYASLRPIRGLTPLDWQTSVPAFHFTAEDSNQSWSLCVGEYFPVGSALPQDPFRVVHLLSNLLSTVNLGSSYHPLESVTIEPWKTWTHAFRLAEATQPQEIFTPALTRREL